MFGNLHSHVIMAWQMEGIYNSIFNKAIIKTFHLKPREESTSIFNRSVSCVVWCHEVTMKLYEILIINIPYYSQILCTSLIQIKFRFILGAMLNIYKHLIIKFEVITYSSSFHDFPTNTPLFLLNTNWFPRHKHWRIPTIFLKNQ